MKFEMFIPFSLFKKFSKKNRKERKYSYVEMITFEKGSNLKWDGGWVAGTDITNQCRRVVNRLLCQLNNELLKTFEFYGTTVTLIRSIKAQNKILFSGGIKSSSLRNNKWKLKKDVHPNNKHKVLRLKTTKKVQTICKYCAKTVLEPNTARDINLNRFSYLLAAHTMVDWYFIYDRARQTISTPTYL